MESDERRREQWGQFFGRMFHFRLVILEFVLHLLRDCLWLGSKSPSNVAHWARSHVPPVPAGEAPRTVRVRPREAAVTVAVKVAIAAATRRFPQSWQETPVLHPRLPHGLTVLILLREGRPGVTLSSPDTLRMPQCAGHRLCSGG